VIQLREVYDQFSRTGHLPDFTQPECDPWCDISSWDVEPMIRARMDAILQAAAMSNSEGVAAYERSAAAAQLRNLNEYSGVNMQESIIPPPSMLLDCSGVNFGHTCGTIPEDKLALEDDITLKECNGRPRERKSKSKKKHKENREGHCDQENETTNSQIQVAVDIVDAARGELHGRAVKVQELEADLARKDAVIMEIQTLAQAATLQLQCIKDVSRLRAVKPVGPAGRHLPQWCLVPAVRGLKKLLAFVG